MKLSTLLLFPAILVGFSAGQLLVPKTKNETICYEACLECKSSDSLYPTEAKVLCIDRCLTNKKKIGGNTVAGTNALYGLYNGGDYFEEMMALKAREEGGGGEGRGEVEAMSGKQHCYKNCMDCKAVDGWNRTVARGICDKRCFPPLCGKP